MYKNYITDDHYYQSMFMIFLITTLFMFIIKYIENNKCNPNKRLANKYIFNWSVLFGIVSVIANYLYDMFLEKECVNKIILITDISIVKYILEGLFIAGCVLLFNQLSYLIYYKCE